MISYAPLWKTLIDKKMKKSELAELIGISSSTLAKMGKDEYVALKVLEKICCSLQCKIEDVIEITY